MEGGKALLGVVNTCSARAVSIESAVLIMFWDANSCCENELPLGQTCNTNRTANVLCSFGRIGYKLPSRLGLGSVFPLSVICAAVVPVYGALQ